MTCFFVTFFLQLDSGCRSPANAQSWVFWTFIDIRSDLRYLWALGKISSPIPVSGHLGGGDIFSSNGVGLVPKV